MRYEQAKDLPPQDFKRLFGVKHPTFDAMVAVMQQHEQLKKKDSGNPKLTLEDQVLVALQYWREYRTYFHIAQDWSVSESTICRTVHKVETVLMRSGRFRLPGKKSLRQAQVPDTIVVDVTESPIERPKRGQKRFYSGKQKRHTFKSQLVIDLSTHRIVCTAHGKGRRHDFHLWKASRVQLHPHTKGLGDRGYQGLVWFERVSDSGCEKHEAALDFGIHRLHLRPRRIS